MEDVRNKDGLTEEEFLSQYNPKDYERPSVTSDMLVLGMNKELDSLKVLLIKRKDHPYINCWALPGGFINPNESAYQAACRELEEETGLTDVYLEQLYTMTQPKRDPRMWVMSIAYIALIQTTDIQAGDDASEAYWFDVSITDDSLVLENKVIRVRIEYKLEKKDFKNGIITIPNYIVAEPVKTKLAFDHADIVLEGLLRIRNKVLYSDIAFNLLPERFTLPDLQRVYEILLGRSLYRGNFRDSIAEKVKPLNEKGSSIVGRKLSQLYTYRGDSYV